MSWHARWGPDGRLGCVRSGNLSAVKVIGHVPGEWKGIKRVNIPGEAQEMWVLSEYGIYFFVGRSERAKALPFQKWLAGEVIPAIPPHWFVRRAQHEQRIAIAPRIEIGVPSKCRHSAPPLTECQQRFPAVSGSLGGVRNVCADARVDLDLRLLARGKLHGWRPGVYTNPSLGLSSMSPTWIKPAPSPVAGFFSGECLHPGGALLRAPEMTKGAEAPSRCLRL